MIDANQVQEVEQIRDRMRNTFSNSYLTLLSIIQGTALATLFLKRSFMILSPSPAWEFCSVRTRATICATRRDSHRRWWASTFSPACWAARK